MTLYTGQITESDKMYQATGYDMYKPDSMVALSAAWDRGLFLGPGMASARKQEREGPFLQEKETAVTQQIPGWESEFLKTAKRQGMGFTEAPRDEYGPITEDVWKESNSYREDLKWDESFTKRKARYLAESKDEENRLDDILDRSEYGFIEFVGEMAGGMLDPFNVAAMFVPIVKGAQTAAWVARYGKWGGRAMTGAVEGIVGATLIEPIILGAASQEQLDYNAYDSLMNISAGLILGSALHTGLGFMGDTLGKARAKTKKISFDTTVGQMIDGRRVDISPIIDTDTGLSGQPRMSEPRYKTELKKTDIKLKKTQSDIVSEKAKIDKTIPPKEIKPLFPEENRLSAIKKDQDVWEAVKIENPNIKETGDVEVYRIGVSDDIKTNDYVTANKETVIRKLDDLKAQGKKGEIITRSVPVEDLMIGKTPTEFIYSPKEGFISPEFTESIKKLDDLELLKMNLEQEIKMPYAEYVDRLGTKEPELPKTKNQIIDSILDENGELNPRKRVWEDQNQVDAVNAEEPEKILTRDEELTKIAEDTNVIENDLINRVKSGQVLEDESLEAAMSVIEEAKIDAEKKSKFVDSIIECFLGNGMSLT